MLFAVMGSNVTVIMMQVPVMALVTAAAIAGFQRSFWIVAGALAAHGLFAWLHAPAMNDGVPS